MKIILHQYNHLDSTNEEALRLISDEKAGEGMVLRTHEQTHGRGIGENSWESEPGKNLTFSVILQPHFLEPSRQFALTEMISLALFDVTERRLGCEFLRIKWPNDLYFNNKKIVGVLVQNRIKADQLDFSVIGVGFNVNQRKFFSDAPNPASLIHFSKKEESLSGLLDEILEQLSYYYEKIKADIKSLEDLYLQKLYRMGEWAGYSDEAGIFMAKITGINRYGQLLMTDRQGNQRIYGFKEVKFLDERFP
ncbi:MAG: biotin--[acetyl-CoA-carboxylase] ligase [bacterium]|nr:MAG: biotin--[acetyl-CoA-carboxylase] ligase [bacterium]